MFIESLSTYNFRNLEDQTVKLSPRVNFIIGENGQGKTNFVEAISLLGRGRSFRTNKAKEFIQSGKKEGSIFANITEAGAKFNLGVSFKREEREYYFNQDKLSSLKQYLGRLVSVSFSPDDLTLIKGGPLGRRNFFDKHILDINQRYIDSIFSYQKALKNKSHILKNSATIQKDQLIPWNTILSEAGAVIIAERLKFIESLTPRVNEYYRIFSKDQTEITVSIRNFQVDYSSFGKESLAQSFDEHRDREIASRSCLVGPHRDEFEIKLNGRTSRVYASQGETRSLVLALKLAVIEEIEDKRRIVPVLILDDVDSELDMSRRQALIEIVFSRERQIVITGTQFHKFEQEKAPEFFLFSVVDGVLRQSTG